MSWKSSTLRSWHRGSVVFDPPSPLRTLGRLTSWRQPCLGVLVKRNDHYKRPRATAVGTGAESARVILLGTQASPNAPMAKEVCELASWGSILSTWSGEPVGLAAPTWGGLSKVVCYGHAVRPRSWGKQFLTHRRWVLREEPVREFTQRWREVRLGLKPAGLHVAAD